jgi:hypothetical protein
MQQLDVSCSQNELQRWGWLLIDVDPKTRRYLPPLSSSFGTLAGGYRAAIKRRAFSRVRLPHFLVDLIHLVLFLIDPVRSSGGLIELNLKPNSHRSRANEAPLLRRGGLRRPARTCCSRSVSFGHPSWGVDIALRRRLSALVGQPPTSEMLLDPPIGIARDSHASGARPRPVPYGPMLSSPTRWDKLRTRLPWRRTRLSQGQPNEIKAFPVFA